jgi:hypothetical protein
MSCHKILRNIKDPYKHVKRYLVGKIHQFLAKFLLLRYWVPLLVTARKLWWMSEELLELGQGNTTDQT